MVHGLALKYLFGPLWFYLTFMHVSSTPNQLLPYGNSTRQITPPLIPKLKGAGDTRHFQEYEEKRDVFKIKTENVHAKEFEDF